MRLPRDFAKYADKDCPDCGGSGEGGFEDMWSQSREEHYTRDMPCACAEDALNDEIQRRLSAEEDADDARREEREYSEN